MVDKSVGALAEIKAVASSATVTVIVFFFTIYS